MPFVKRLVPYVIGVLLLTGAWVIGFRQGTAMLPRTARAVREGGFQYINPLLLCSSNTTTNAPELNPLRDALQKYADQSRNTHHVTRMSVFFGDLNQGHWTGVAENDTYSPASLLKVSELLTFLSQADEYPAILDERLRVVAGNPPDQAEHYHSVRTVNPGETLSVNDLLVQMIMYSSNAALQTLRPRVDTDRQREMHRLLGIGSAPADDPYADFLSPKQYAAFFRVLYNGTYLSRSSSEQALELLARTDFRDGLVAGLPDGIAIAHKFGERGFASKDDPLNVDRRELHDCGIVYLPGRPYLLCVMTEGTSFPQLAKTISGVSTLIYDRMKKFSP